VSVLVFVNTHWHTSHPGKIELIDHMKSSMHIFEENGPTIPFTGISWEKFIKSVFLWKSNPLRFH